MGRDRRALSRRSPALQWLPQIDAAIEALRREGAIERIIRGDGD